jgi:16S rRNA (uracil1498-N3)-methyltransferase
VRNGIESVVALETVDAHEVQGRVVERRPAEAEPGVRLTLAVPILRGERTEQVIAAVTQLGVAGIVPFVSARSVVRELTPAKHERWRRIARESAETARRGRIPEIGACVGWDGLFDVLEPPILVAWEHETSRRLRDAMPEGGFSLVIGPEGGLDETEVELARTRGAVIVSLGRRNLRSETAAIAAVAQAMAAVER